jgi:hypothetical protein
MEQFGTQIIMVLTIVGGVMAIIQYIKSSGKEEKTNAVEIARIQKDIEAQRTANVTLRQETQAEISHINSDIREIKQNQETMRETQFEMKGDVKRILAIIEKK